jgi:hypothetical protein
MLEVFTRTGVRAVEWNLDLVCSDHLTDLVGQLRVRRLGELRLVDLDSPSLKLRFALPTGADRLVPAPAARGEGSGGQRGWRWEMSRQIPQRGRCGVSRFPRA